MNKRRWMIMLALPLVLGVLLGAAKWKQMHPTETQLDLQERAILQSATVATAHGNGYTVSIPINEFKATINDFYFLDNNPDSMPGGYVPILTIEKVDGESRTVIGKFEIGRDTPYASYKSANSKSPFRQGIHPVTSRRLKVLMLKYLPY